MADLVVNQLTADSIISGPITSSGAVTAEDLILSGQNALWIDSRTSLSLVALATLIGNNVQDIYIAREELVEENLVLPVEWRLHFTNGGKITVAVDKSLTLGNQQIDAGDWQLFDGAGTIVFSEGTILKISWFVSLEDALQRIGSASCTLLFDSPVTLFTSANVGANTVLTWPTIGCPLTIAADKILGNVGAIIAGDYSIVEGDGDITFASQGLILRSAWFQNLRNAVEHIGTSICLLVVSKSETIDVSTTIPSNITLVMIPGVLLTVNAGVTFTVEGKIHAYEAFTTGEGTVVLPEFSYLGLKYLAVGGAAADINAGELRINANRLIIDNGAQFAEGYDPSEARAIADQLLIDLAAQEALLNQAIIDLGNLQLDNRIVTFWQPDAPTTDLDDGDLWFDTDGNNAIYRYNGNTQQWDPAADNRLATLQQSITSLEATIDGKTITYFRTSYEAWPTGSEGDLLFITDTGLMRVWHNGAWVQQAQNGVATTYSDSAPIGPKVGDLWFVISSKVLYRWNGVGWDIYGEATSLRFEGGFVTAGGLLAASAGGIVDAGIYGGNVATNNIRFWAGGTLAQAKSPTTTVPFRVYNDGSVVANNITVESGQLGIRINGAGGAYTRLADGIMSYIDANGLSTSYIRRIEVGECLHGQAKSFASPFTGVPKLLVVPWSIKTFEADNVTQDQYLEIGYSALSNTGFTPVIRLTGGTTGYNAKNSTISLGGQEMTWQTPEEVTGASINLEIQPNSIEGNQLNYNQGGEDFYVVTCKSRSITYDVAHKINGAADFTVVGGTRTLNGSSVPELSKVALSISLGTLSPGIYTIRVRLLTRAEISTFYLTSPVSLLIAGGSIKWKDTNYYGSNLSELAVGYGKYIAVAGN